MLGAAIWLVPLTIKSGLFDAILTVLPFFVLAVLASIPSLVPLRFLLPAVLHLPKLRWRWFGLVILIVNLFLMAITPLLLFANSFGRSMEDVRLRTIHWESVGFAMAFASPYLLAALFATFSSCRPWLVRQPLD